MKPKKDDRAIINIKIDDKIRDKFKSITSAIPITMQELIHSFICEYVKNPNIFIIKTVVEHNSNSQEVEPDDIIDDAHGTFEPHEDEPVVVSDTDKIDEIVYKQGLEDFGDLMKYVDGR